jgi:multidrug efflux system membrane fusion protein
MRIIPIVTAVAVSATLYGFIMERDALMALAGATPPEPAAAVEVTPPVLRVSVSRVTARDIDSGVVLRGRTQAPREVEVRAETSGLVISPPRPRGSSVVAGDLLCELDPGTRMASLAEAEARLAEAEINYSAATRLTEGGFASQTRVASADAGRRAALAGVEAVRAELGRLTIRAPFDGILETDTAELGSLLTPGALCGRVIQLDPMLFVGYASEAQIDRIGSGALAGARLANGTEVLGRVGFVARMADSATRTFRVEVAVPNSDLSLRAGQSADILIAAQSERGALVPVSALTLDDTGRLGLRLVDADSRVMFAPVTILRDSAQGIWVQGLPDPADVIVVGQEFVTEGVTVEAVMRD